MPEETHEQMPHRPDVPINPVFTGYNAVPVRDPNTGDPVVVLRFSTPLGAFHFFFPAEVTREMGKKFREVADAAELLPPLESHDSSNAHPKLYVPGNN